MNQDFSKLDYNDIKQNLIAFLKTQDKFNGYNFEGSTLNILLDILAYNTHYQAFYNNIAFNEAFLDTAQNRSSVVSIAKALGYTPKSATSAVCSVEVFKNATSNGSIVSNGTTNPYVLPKYTLFKTNKEGAVYYFRSLADAVFVPATYNSNGIATSYSTGPINIKEGTLKTVSHVINGSNPFEKISIVSQTIDTETINVIVSRSVNDSTGSLELWTEAKNITEIDGNSNVYFLEEGPDGNYRIYFGDGIIGKKLQDGNLITIQFLECSGEDGNNIGINDAQNARIFTITSDATVNRVEVITPGFGGGQKETISSIRYNAPKMFTTQERAVTVSDYENIIKRDYDFIKSIKCWGGEDNDPPAYGKIFISVKPENRAALSKTEKSAIVKSLTRNKSVVGIIPEIVDPNVIYLILNCEIKVDIVKYKGNINQLRSKILAQINDYIINNLDVFDADLIVNELEQSVLDSDEAILSVNIIPQLEYRLSPVYNIKRDYTFNLQNKIIKSENITKPNFKSSSFLQRDHTNILRTCNIYDDGYGNLYTVFISNGRTYSLGVANNYDLEIYSPESIGSIDYETGKIYLNDFNPVNSGNSVIKFYANIVDVDVFVNPNTILSIDTTDPNSVAINLIESAFRKPIR